MTIQKKVQAVIDAENRLKLTMDSLGNCVWCRGTFGMWDEVCYEEKQDGWSHQHCFDQHHSVAARIGVRAHHLKVQLSVVPYFLRKLLGKD